MNTGQIIIFDEQTPEELIPISLISSCSIPMIFPPVELGEMMLIDGGTFANIALGDPIQRCIKEEGVHPSDIIVDVIICLKDPLSVSEWSVEDPDLLNAFGVY